MIKSKSIIPIPAPYQPPAKEIEVSVEELDTNCTAMKLSNWKVQVLNAQRGAPRKICSNPNQMYLHAWNSLSAKAQSLWESYSLMKESEDPTYERSYENLWEWVPELQSASTQSRYTQYEKVASLVQRVNQSPQDFYKFFLAEEMLITPTSTKSDWEKAMDIYLRLRPWLRAKIRGMAEEPTSRAELLKFAQRFWDEPSDTERRKIDAAASGTRENKRPRDDDDPKESGKSSDPYGKKRDGGSSKKQDSSQRRVKDHKRPRREKQGNGYKTLPRSGDFLAPDHSKLRCFNCEKPGHISPNCPEPDNRKVKAHQAKTKGKGKDGLGDTSY